MRRLAIGWVAGVAVWVGSAVAAEAQSIQIQPVGPTAISTSSTSALYKANLTPGSSACFDVQLKVYVNSESTPRYTSTISLLSILGTKLYQKNISLSGWNLQVGDVVKFHLECWWDPNGQLSSNDYSVTVSGS
jgi:hypothetical protein